MIIELQKAFQHIIYSDKAHTYFNTKLNKALVPTTTYKKQWENEFDLEYWSDYKAKSWRVEQQLVKDLWRLKSDTSLSRGSYLHRKLEDLGRRKIFEIPKPINTSDEMILDIQNIAKKYFSEFNGIIIDLETVIGNHIVGGQIDKICIIEDKIVLRDYKTGELKPAYKDKKLKEPFTDLEDSSVGKYTLQLNVYRQILEDVGIHVDKLEIVHFEPDFKSYKIVELPKVKINWN